MRVLLVQPDYKRSGPSLTQKLLPSRSLLQLAAILEEHGHQAVVLDPLTAISLSGDSFNLDVAAAVEKTLQKEEFDAAGIAVYMATRREARQAAGAVKKAFPRMPVIAGGPLPARLGKEMLKAWPEFDYACLGGAESSLPALINSLSGKPGPLFKVQGIARRAGPRVARQYGKPVYHADMEALPPTQYRDYIHRLGRGIERAYVMSARGCPYWCNFCSNLWKKLLLANPKAVAEEIVHLVRDAGVKRIIFYDDCFGARPRHSRAVLEAVIESGVQVELQAVTRFDTVDREWLDAFKMAGGVDVLAGLETGSSRLRRKMNKHMDESDLCRGAELVRSAGLRLGVFIMLGFPGEEEQDIGDTYRLLKKLDPHQVMSTIFDIKPGDMLFEFATSAKMISTRVFLEGNRRIVNEMSQEELEKNAARAMAFDRIFHKSTLMPEHDPAAMAADISFDRIETLMRQEEERLTNNATG